MLGAVACAFVLGGCADSLEPRRPDGPGVTGRAILVDDTGRPPLADGGGEIVAIPESVLPELQRRIGPGEPDDLVRIGFTLDPNMVAELGGEIVSVDDDGHFRLTHTGPHLICRLPDSSTSTAFVRGCDRVDLPVSGALTVSFGEGGYRAELIQL